MTQSFTKKLLNYQRDNGTRQLIKACLIKLKNTLFSYEREVVGYISVTDQAFSANPKVPVTVRTAEISDVPALKILSARYKKRDFLHWINDRYIFYVAQLKDLAESEEASSPHHEGETPSGSLTLKRPLEEARIPGPDKKIVGYICVCPAKKSTHKIISMLNLEDTDYWGVDAYIHPAYRGKGIAAAMASGFLAQAKRDGFKRGFGGILANNNASRRSFSFIGVKEIGLYTTITIMGFAFYFLRRAKGYEEYFK